MQGIKKKHKFGLWPTALLLLCLSITTSLQAQDDVVKPLSKTRLRPFNYEIGLYAGGGTMNCGELWKGGYTSEGMISVKGSPGKMYGSYLDIGIEAEASKFSWWSLCGSIGYRHNHYAYNQGFFDRTGLNSHFIATDLHLSFVDMYVVGAKSDIFIDSYTHTAGQLAYEGLNSNCFNKASLAWYIGLQYKLNAWKFRLCYGYFIKPQLNVDKLAYYNMEKVELKGEFFELRLAYRLFTTKSKTYINE